MALCQFLPGPASSQVGIAIGAYRAGCRERCLPGSASLCHPHLPCFLLTTAFVKQTPKLLPWLAGLKIIAVAVVAQAVWDMGVRMAADKVRASLALLSTHGGNLVVSSVDELQEAVKLDHVCAEYENNYRSADNFVKSDVIVMDCDNDHTEDPDEWITPAALDELMPDVSYAIAPSRHNMLPKGGKTARPKFHVYFSIEEISDAEGYVALKRAVHAQFSFFDDNALDAARFIYGADTGEVIWHEGWLTIDELLQNVPEPSNTGRTNSIPEGHRNNTLSRFAGRVVKR